MASTYIDLSKSGEEDSINVVQESNFKQIHYESMVVMECILEELKKMNLHLSIITDEEI